MRRVPSIVPVSDLRLGAANVLAKLRKTKQPVVITQRGRAAAVLISMESYEEAEREREILRRIAQGEREVAKGKTVDLADVLAAADRIIGK
jgi:prevent-host-death family protein